MNDEFAEHLAEITTQYKNLFIAGDFNFHLNTEDPEAELFSSIMDAMGFVVHVNFATHIAGNILDQIFTELHSDIDVLSCNKGPLISDHNIVECLTNIPRNNTQSCKITTRKYKDIYTQKFKNDLKMDYLDNAIIQLETLLKSFEIDIISTLDKHSPLKTRRVTHRKKQPYYNEQLRNKKCRVRNRERNIRDMLLFMKETNITRCFIYIKSSAKIIECGNDTKKLYNLVNNITGRVKENPMPPDKSVSSLAEEFSDFFITKILKICESLGECESFNPTHVNIPNFCEFKYMAEEEVETVIKSIPTKSCECDCIYQLNF